MTKAEWRKRYYAEVELNIERAEQINANALVRSRPMTEKEKDEIFVRKNYQYCKEIII